MLLSLCSINYNCIYIRTGSFVLAVLRLKFASCCADVMWLCRPISAEELLEEVLRIQKLHDIWKSLRGNKEGNFYTVIKDFIGTTSTNEKVSLSETKRHAP
jgi:hypothetical protein